MKKVNDYSKELGLAERIQPSATGIYTTQNTPTGDAMPNYTQTQTSQTIEFSSSEQRKKDEYLRHLLSLTPEERRILFEHFKDKYNNEIHHHVTNLMLWAATTEHNQDAPLTMTDYERKIREERDKLKAMDETLPIQSYFHNGSNDTDKCGHLLIIKYTEWDEAQLIYALELLSGIQWLIEQKEQLMAAATKQEEVKNVPQHEIPNENTMSKDENEELAKVYKGLNLDAKNRLNSQNGNSYKHGMVLTAIMHMYQDEKKPWADNPSCFAKELVEHLPETRNLSSEDKKKKLQALARSMNREMESIKGLHLKSLSVESIVKMTGCLDRAAQAVYSQWEGLYSIVLNCRDNIRDKKKTEEDKATGH